MLARDETAMPSAAQERVLLERVAGALAGDSAIVDVAALAGDQPVATLLATALREHVVDDAVIVCAGVLERLAGFVELVEALVALSAERGATVVLSVPNDAFSDNAAAMRRSAWGEGTVDELRRLLPDDHVLLHEVVLRGAALVAAGQDAGLPVTVNVDPRATVPVSYVLVFGPRAAAVAPAATAVAADLRAERARDRERTAELEVLRARLREVAPVAQIGGPDETGSPR
jgi:hypothetical protein